MKYSRRAILWGALAVVVFFAAVYHYHDHTLISSEPANNVVKAENAIASNNDVSKATDVVTRNIVLHPDSNWKLSSPLALSIDALFVMARSDDNEARYILARNLEYCYFSAKSEVEYEGKRQQALSFSDADSAITRIDLRYRYCADIKPSAYDAFFSHLEASAAGGFTLAQEHYGALYANLYMKVQGFSDLKRDDYIAKRDAFEKRKVEFLDHAMRSGSINAMARLSQHASQQLGSYGLVESYAINNTIMQLTDDNTVFNRYAWLNEKLEQRLTQTEVLDALAQSQALIATINNSPTL